MPQGEGRSAHYVATSEWNLLGGYCGLKGVLGWLWETATTARYTHSAVSAESERCCLNNSMTLWQRFNVTLRIGRFATRIGRIGSEAV